MTDAPAPAPAPATPKPAAEAFVFGVDPVLAPSENQVVAFAVMCNVVCSTDGREVITSRPLYEFPLLKRMYQARGGDAKIEAAWLVNPRTGSDALARTVPLTRHTLRMEMGRCQAAFRLPRPNGEPRKLFDEVYGIGATNRFVEAVKAQAKAYKALVAKYAAANAARPKHSLPALPTADEWLAIAALAEPPATAVDALEALEALEAVPDTQVEGFTPIDDSKDGATELMVFLTAANMAPDAAQAIATLHADNRVSIDTLRSHPAFNGKKDAIREGLALYQKWLDKLATA